MEAHLKYVYVNACILGNMQEELELYMRSQNCEITRITESWWDSSHGWGVVMDENKE